MSLRLSDEMPFGKYEGEEIEDLLYDHPKYLAWLVEQDIVEFEQEVIEKMQERKLI